MTEERAEYNVKPKKGIDSTTPPNHPRRARFTQQLHPKRPGRAPGGEGDYHERGDRGEDKTTGNEA